MLAEVPGYNRKVAIGADPSKACIQRWLGKMSPEPETQAWIDSLPAGEVFFDVGANVGTFAVRACLHGMQVVAFEPVLEHYVELCGIIQINKLPILAFNLAMEERFRVGAMGRGRSTHTLLTQQLGKPGVLAVTLDEMSDFLGMAPAHIKIDVDGDEFNILCGAVETLPSVKSLLVEIDPNIVDHNKIPFFMNSHGLFHDEEQVRACRIEGGKYDGMANHIFRRT